MDFHSGDGKSGELGFYEEGEREQQSQQEERKTEKKRRRVPVICRTPGKPCHSN